MWQGYEKTRIDKEAGNNWVCATCFFNIFSFRSMCFKCEEKFPVRQSTPAALSLAQRQLELQRAETKRIRMENKKLEQQKGVEQQLTFSKHFMTSLPFSFIFYLPYLILKIQKCEN